MLEQGWDKCEAEALLVEYVTCISRSESPGSENKHWGCPPSHGMDTLHHRLQDFHKSPISHSLITIS
jgi:hypothetical protein